MTQRIWTAALLIIGDEILSGRTQDKNVAQIATWLNVQGIRLAEVRIVADVEERIVKQHAAGFDPKNVSRLEASTTPEEIVAMQRLCGFNGLI